MPIETIFFDFGGVIIKTPSLKWINRWKHLLGINDHPEILDMLENPHESQLVQDICTGKIPEDHMWVMMAEKWHIKPALIEQFRRRLFTKRQLNTRLIKFIAELHGQYQTAILSNAGDKSRRLMEDTYQLLNVVDEIIISAEEGVIKPDHQIFVIAMDRLKTSPEESLLLDDSLANIFAARNFGMQAVQFINNQQAIQSIQDHLNGRV